MSVPADTLALQIAELLRPHVLAAVEEAIETAVGPASTANAPRLVDAATVAEALQVSRAWVYYHADELGAVRLGGGSRPRLRFDLGRARDAQVGERSGSSAPRPRRRRQSALRGALLPIKGGT